MQPDAQPGAQPADKAQPAVPQEAPVPAEQPVPAPVPGAPAPAEGAVIAPAPEAAPVAVPQTEAAPTTPEELKRAQAIAEDPSKSTETVILPIDKGAAVLDSQKESETGPQAVAPTGRTRARPEPVASAPLPTSDAQAQSGFTGGQKAAAPIPPVTAGEGERMAERPRFERPEGARETSRIDNRTIIQFDGRTVVRGDDDSRFTRGGEEQYFEKLPGGITREVIVREDGSQVVTLRNRYGDMIQRSRIDPRGREYVLFYAPEMMEEPDHDYAFRDPGRDLPPMRLQIPVRDYIIDTTSDPDRDYYEFLEQPPVEPVERVYSLDEVKYSARIRDKVRRIDLDTITFPTGSAEISMGQAKTLRKVADAISQILEKNPAETFLIEGHTDAVGSDTSNLILSDKRAESVANVLTDVYGIAPENLATQGYGERYLKVRTLTAEQQNRRVTIRRVTSLVRPVAAVK